MGGPSRAQFPPNSRQFQLFRIDVLNTSVRVFCNLRESCQDPRSLDRRIGQCSGKLGISTRAVVHSPSSSGLTRSGLFFSGLFANGLHAVSVTSESASFRALCIVQVSVSVSVLWCRIWELPLALVFEIRITRSLMGSFRLGAFVIGVFEALIRRSGSSLSLLSFVRVEPVRKRKTKY